MIADAELLDQYLSAGDEQAFRELVARYANLVFATAHRIAGDPHSAEDITQEVFLRLARSARRLKRDSVLAGWLHSDTRLVALQFLRRERRRRVREEFAMNQSKQDDAECWREIAPLIDEAMSAIPARERDAVLLRFFQGRSFQEAGLALGITPDATRMRVGRALERVRDLLARKGIRSSTAALSSVLMCFAVEQAPASLVSAASIAAGTKAGASITGGIIMSKLSIAATAVLAVTVGVTLHTLRTNALHRESRALAAANTMLEGKHDEDLAEIQALKAELAGTAGMHNEIARLRAELTAAHRLQITNPVPQSVPAVSNRAQKQPLITEMEAREFLGRPAEEQGRILGRMRAEMMGHSSFDPEQFARDRALAERVRPELEQLERRPDAYADFQTEFIKQVIGLEDPDKLKSIQQLLLTTCETAVSEGVDALSKPAENVERWMLKRDALDRPATHRLEALLSEEERQKFSRAFLGIMGIDLGVNDGAWHRFKTPDGRGVLFPTESPTESAK